MTRHAIEASLAAVAAMLAVSSLMPAQAQEAGSRPTREFVQAAGAMDTFETMEAYSAIALSTDPQVVAFARTMLTEHARTFQGLTQAATSAGLQPPMMAVAAAQAPFLAALQSQRGTEFDKLYWKQQMLAHTAALTVTQQYAADGDTPAIRQAAAATLPLIQAHLAMARRMTSQVSP